ncbi:MAG: PTS transporter subunit EIIC [Anaerorhabdus sp.]|uniref:PTS sugar transporter subunit IIC n=1 Tax=Anaerorhabdus sp. TaxID=1872524 RepID=UPI002B1FC46E|nr:PTS transporter subunit EIIC [Anaerorhabdus sp.]MEA4875678.1 PTS transporter subunit EIIC [Anaerorhabdus sp.]
MNSMNWIEKKLLPIANKLQRNRYLQSLQSAFMTLIPIMMVGSICIIICNPLRDYTTMAVTDSFYSFFKGWRMFLDAYGEPITILSWTCLYSISLWVTITISYNLSRHYKLNSLLPTLLSLSSFFVLCTTLTGDGGFASDYWGGEGLFAAIIIGIGVTELYRIFTAKKIGYIDMPDMVPPALRNSLGSLCPVILIAAMMVILSIIIRTVFGCTFPQLILNCIHPIVVCVDNVFGLAFSSVLTQVVWWFGIHNTSVTGMLEPLMMSNYAANAAAYTAGVATTQLPHVWTEMLWWNFMVIGGSGATFGLVFLLLKSKSKQLKTLGKLSLIPSLFNINEPIIFGLPIVLNPLFLVPWIGAQTVNGIISYIVMQLGLISRTFIDPGWNMPPIISQFLATLDFRAVILAIILIILDALIYYPFLKVYEKQKLLEENTSEELMDEA